MLKVARNGLSKPSLAMDSERIRSGEVHRFDEIDNVFFTVLCFDSNFLKYHSKDCERVSTVIGIHVLAMQSLILCSFTQSTCSFTFSRVCMLAIIIIYPIYLVEVVLSVCSFVYEYGMFYVRCDHVEGKAKKHIHIFTDNLHIQSYRKLALLVHLFM